MPDAELQDPHARTLVMSYLSIRRSIGVLGLVLPPMLWPGGWIVVTVHGVSNYEPL